MKKLLLDIISELKLVLAGKSLDILLPPILFLLLNNLWSLPAAIIGSTILGFVFLAKRILHKENILYAVGGIIGIILANISIYINNNTANFFLPDLISTFSLIILTMITLIIKKPLAIWVSHITRGWDLKWFYRKDVLPAYREVTIFWLLFFILRFSMELYLYLNSTLEELVLFNVILGFPVFIGVLTFSYIYGITRLRNLGGPGIDEFKNQSPPPWKGQRKGF
ncbi:MAG TPA: DUF3159 domain-containing protein [Candidatus Izemoplasmatales bacterium]|nr:DUF3159 domain-containing protein [Candidatus Izemoplasmatales bacterium]